MMGIFGVENQNPTCAIVPYLISKFGIIRKADCLFFTHLRIPNSKSRVLTYFYFICPKIVLTEINNEKTISEKFTICNREWVKSWQTVVLVLVLVNSLFIK
jgi:hypothetical protein